MLHPNSLAFYFFHAGINKKSPWKILFVPVCIIPYGIALAYLLFPIKESFRKAIENPIFMTSILLFWLVLAFIYAKKKK
jgi:NADH:ubiquinone oxidoreductase subunit 3 (subunit A)